MLQSAVSCELLSETRQNRLPDRRSSTEFISTANFQSVAVREDLSAVRLTPGAAAARLSAILAAAREALFQCVPTPFAAANDHPRNSDGKSG